MLAKFSGFLLNSANFIHIGLLVILFLGFQFLIFPVFLERMGASEPYKIPDLMFGFSIEQAYAFLSHLGVDGRKAYLTTQMWVDSVYPLIYGFMLALIIGKIHAATPGLTKKYKRLNLVPIAAAFADYLENTGIIVMLLAYPAKIGFAAHLASVFGMIKWTLIGISIGIIFLSLLYFVFLSKKFNCDLRRFS
ncbi:MAG TPA: hypothetical protein VLH61_09875 [Bacteroidales bacterium]|nr:hypothetical protein [Bacteroidales bacterium]